MNEQTQKPSPSFKDVVCKHPVQLMDHEGKVVFFLKMSMVPPTPYLVWMGRLFVLDRDRAGVYLERQYMILAQDTRPNQGVPRDSISNN